MSPMARSTMSGIQRLVRSWRNLGTVAQDEHGNLVYKPNDRTWVTGEYPGRLYPTPTWETVKQLLDMTDLKTMLKGLMIAEDVERAVEVGADTVCATRATAPVTRNTSSCHQSKPASSAITGGRASKTYLIDRKWFMTFLGGHGSPAFGKMNLRIRYEGVSRNGPRLEFATLRARSAGIREILCEFG